MRIMPWLVLISLAATAPWSANAATPDTDWPVYLGDKGRSHYSALAQIDRTNVARLKVA